MLEQENKKLNSTKDLINILHLSKDIRGLTLKADL